MPLTLPLDAYSALMGKKGVDAKTSAAHHARMRGMLASFETGGAHVLGPVDVGDDAYWWDYGQLKLYLRNALRLAEDGAEAGAMREFLGVARGGASGAFSVDGKSTTSSCLVQRGTATRSVLANVTAREVEATGCVLVNVTAKKVVAGEGAIAYRGPSGNLARRCWLCCLLEENNKSSPTRREVSRRVFVSSRSVAARNVSRTVFVYSIGRRPQVQRCRRLRRGPGAQGRRGRHGRLHGRRLEAPPAVDVGTRRRQDVEAGRRGQQVLLRGDARSPRLTFLRRVAATPRPRRG